MSLKKFTLLLVAIGILMAMGLSTVAAQEQPQLFQPAAECSDPSFLLLPSGNPPAALLQIIPTPYGVYLMYLVYIEQDAEMVLAVGYVDLYAAVVYQMDWAFTDIPQDAWVAFPAIQDAPSIIPKTLLAWNIVQVWVVNCGSEGFKYQFNLVTENPGPEATTPEAELSLPLGQ